MSSTFLPWERQQNRNGFLVRIKEVAAKQGIAGVEDNETRFQNLQMDSLDFIDLILAMDEEFGVTIPPEDAAKFENVGAMIDWLEGKDAGPFEFKKASGEEFFDNGRYKPW